VFSIGEILAASHTFCQEGVSSSMRACFFPSQHFCVPSMASLIDECKIDGFEERKDLRKVSLIRRFAQGSRIAGSHQ